MLFSIFSLFFSSNCIFVFLDSNISIPAVIVSHEDGVSLNNKYLYSTGYKIFISSDIQPNLSYYLLPFAIVIGVCLLLTISFMVCIVFFVRLIFFKTFLIWLFCNQKGLSTITMYTRKTKSSTSSSIKKIFEKINFTKI